MAKFPQDRFDSVPSDVQRVGAHRAPKKRGRGWIGFAWAVAATIVLSGAGIIGVVAIDESIRFDFLTPDRPAPTIPTVAPTAEPVVDAEVPLTILNGTPTVGLSNQVGDVLVDQGWAGAAEGLGSRANASTNDVEETTIYYADESLEGAARGLVLALGVGQVRLSADFPGSQITVVIGLDYKPIAAP